MTAFTADNDFPEVDVEKDVELLHSVASGQLMFGNVEKAYNILSLALYLQPKNGETLHRIIKAELDLGLISKAIKRFSELREVRSPGTLTREDHKLFARALLMSGRTDKWRQVLSKLNAEVRPSEAPMDAAQTAEGAIN